MNTVQQHPDGWIIVRIGKESYMDTPANFKTDFGVDIPPLPDGALERIYDQGKRHVFHGEDGILDGGEMPWPLGDQLIDSLRVGLLKKEAREKLAREEEVARVRQAVAAGVNYDRK